jgi:phage portal protein BeeE
MKLFGRRAVRETARPFLLRGLWGQTGEPLPRSYEAQVRSAYLGNPVAQRAVRVVAEAVASVVVDAGAADGAPLHSPSGAASFPAPASVVTPELLESIATHLLLHGNAYVHVAQDADGMPARLFALRPERIKVEPDAGGWPAAYLYRAGEAKRRFTVRDGLGRPEVVHVRAQHPLDDHYGMGCLGAAAAAVAVHNAAGRWNKALLDNAARPSGALVYQPGDGTVLSTAQFERLREEMEAQFAGAGNAGRPLLLDGGLKWQAMSLTPADMDFVSLKEAAAREIALAFGVPPCCSGCRATTPMPITVRRFVHCGA